MANYVHGDGPHDATSFWIGEAPGKTEDEEGIPFCGYTGHYFDNVLYWCGVPRENIYVTNIYKFWPGRGPDGKDLKPTPEQIEEHRPIIESEFKLVQPRLVIPMGTFACEWALGREVDLETENGVAREVELLGHHVLVLPLYHPASGLHDPRVAARAFWGLMQACRFVKGENGYIKQDRWEIPDYSVLRPVPREIRAKIISIDTEGTKDRPHCLTFSTRAGEGKLIYATDAKGLTFYADTYLFHHAIYDLEVIDAMGVTLLNSQGGPDIVTLDTMVGAYNLQVEPRALKKLERRHFDIHSPEFSEVVDPYLKTKQREFFDVAWASVDLHFFEDKKTKKGKVTGRKVSAELSGDLLGAAKRVDRVQKDLAKGKPVDLASRWKAASDMEQQIMTGLAQRPWPTMDPSLIPEDILVPYACRDSDMPLRILPELNARLEAQDLQKVFALDCAVIPYVARMQKAGMYVDVDYLKQLGAEWRAELDAEQAAIEAEFGVNIGSPEQLSELLYQRLHLPVGRMTKGGQSGEHKRPSTDKKALSGLKGRHPIVDRIETFRAGQKLCSTYVDGVLRNTDEFGILHPTFIIAGDPETGSDGVVSGRFAAKDPNILAIPNRTKRGLMIRHAFLAGPLGTDTFEMLTCDLSQIELRIGAHMSQDKALMEAFLAGDDLHQRTVDNIFKATGLKILRVAAKTVNFGIFYGLTAHGLYENLKVIITEAARKEGKDMRYVHIPDERECQAIIDGWYAAYPGVRKMQIQIGRQMMRDGFVRGYSGRIRYTPELFYPDERSRSKALREGCNYPIQEGASWFIKSAMTRIFRGPLRSLWDLKVPVEPLLQIHDELIFRQPKEWTEAVGMIVQKEMIADSHLLSVPLQAKWVKGQRWDELEK